MKPAHFAIRSRPRPICQLCDYIIQQPARPRRLLSTSTLKAPATARQLPRPNGPFSQIATRTVSSSPRTKAKRKVIEDSEEGASRNQKIQELGAILENTENAILEIYKSESVASEQTILEIIESLGYIATQAIELQLEARSGSYPRPVIQQSSAASVLNLVRDDDKPPKAPSNGNHSLPTPDHISTLAYNLLCHPTVFISPKILELYVQLQRLVHRPRTIAQIFRLYATKPVPIQGTSPPQYKKSNPKSPKQAIPAHLAERALDSAISTKDLPLALDLIELTYRTYAWRRSKIVNQLMLPAGLMVATPFALWELSRAIVEEWLTGNIAEDTMRGYVLAGLCTYVLGTGTLGYVALTTRNDQFDRVSWEIGMPLRYRWLREEERAAIDRVAGAWGFKEKWKRGEEEGEEWEALKTWVAFRGMVLDKVTLMEGMQ